MRLRLLDTNIASHIMRRDDAEVLKRLADLPTEEVAVSSVTKGELLYGLAKRQNSPVLLRTVTAFLQTVAVLPWTSETAEVYGTLKAKCKSRGIALSALDMMIAAHAVSLNAILVTREKAFDHIGESLEIESWIQ